MPWLGKPMANATPYMKLRPFYTSSPGLYPRFPRSRRLLYTTLPISNHLRQVFGRRNAQYRQEVWPTATRYRDTVAINTKAILILVYKTLFRTQPSTKEDSPYCIVKQSLGCVRGSYPYPTRQAIRTLGRAPTGTAAHTHGYVAHGVKP